MNIEYKNGKKIVTHSTGHVDTYDKAHCEKQLEREKLRATETQSAITEIESSIEAIDESIEP